MKYTSIFLILLCVATLNASVVLQHTQPVSANQDRETDLSVLMTGEKARLHEFMLFYRPIGELAYREIVKNPSDIYSDEVIFTLPEARPPITGYEYYFQLNSDQGVQTLPVNSPKLSPYKLLVGASASPTSAEFILLNEDLKVSPNEDLVFAISFYGLEDAIDLNSIKVMANGKDVTANANISSPLVVYTMKKPPSGNQSMQVLAKLKSGKSIRSQSWSYSVSDKASIFDSLPMNLRGDALFISNARDLTLDSADSLSVNNVESDASFRMNLYANKKWFSFRSRIYLSSYESHLKQPINKYSLGFSIPHLDLDFIDSSPDYGQFLLSNRCVRGLSGRIHFGSLSIQGVYGESKRSIEGKTNEDGSFTGGTFQRNTIGGKIELGRLDGLQLGFGFAKNKDDLASLDEKYYMSADSTEALATAKDNVVLGASARIGIDRQRFVIGAEVAASIYNSNINDGVLTKEELEDYLGDELPFDPEALEDIIIINKNIEPFIPNIANVAYQVYLRWFLLGNYLTATYSEVGASFKSLSASFAQSDSKIITVSDNIGLFNNQFVLDGGVNIISDNLSQQKETTNTNTNWYAQALIRPRNLPYLKVGYSLNQSSDDLEERLINQEMDTMSFGVGYSFHWMPLTTPSIDVSTYVAKDKDLTENSMFDIKRDNYQVTLQNTLKIIPLTTRLNIGSTKSESALTEETSEYFQWGLKNEYELWEGVLKPYFDMRFSSFENNKYSNYELGTVYKPFTRTTINTSVEFSNDEIERLEPSIDELKTFKSSLFNWRLTIAQRF